MSGVSKVSHGGNIWEASERYGFPTSRILDFSANINFLGPSPRVVETLRDALSDIVHYPDPHARPFQREVARYMGVDEEHVLAGNGATEIIHLLGCLPGLRCALIPSPTFSEYGFAMKRAGVEVRCLALRERDGFTLRAGEIIHNLEGVDVLFLCNPNNPTGRLIDEVELDELVEFCEHKGIRIVLDESFIDFVPDGRRRSFAPRVGRYKELVVVFSLTKFFAIPGIRLGCGLGRQELIHFLKGKKPPWSVNSLAQVAGIAALRDREYILASTKAVALERAFLYGRLRSISKLKVYPSSANFLLMRLLAREWDSRRLARVLARKGILVRDCSNFEFLGRRFIRVAVRSRKENLRLLQELERLVALGGLGHGV